MVIKQERKRYLVVQFIEELDIKELNKMLRRQFRYLHGELNLVRSGIYILDSKVENQLIIKCNHNMRDMVEASLHLIRDSLPAFQVLFVTGTIKKISRIVQDSDELVDD
jgi:RNase P/RNase MRP subunit POP5